tara:strand:+ start:372 stop:1391 length:1020 start_codon:yes stop_codon:yes gene_type:complete
MSINFPTAFWKNQKKVAEEVVTINWSTSLYFSPLASEDALGPDNVVSTNGYRTDSSNGPFQPNPESNSEIFNRGYVTPGAGAYPSEDSVAYFGWYRNGDNTYGQFAHRTEPWLIEDETLKINLFTEADWSTIDYINNPLSNSELTIGSDLIPYYHRYYNGFVQSGSAIGTFTLESPKTMTVLVSGLSETYGAYAGNNSGSIEETFDISIVYLKQEDQTREAICSGRNRPSDTEFIPPNGRPWDVNHALLFTGGQHGTQEPYYDRLNLNTSIDYYFDTNYNGTYNNVVNQSQRRDYVRAVSQFTGVRSLSAGTHQVEVHFTTNDGNYSSGSFIGATFSFS